MIRGELRKLLSSRFLPVALTVLFLINCYLTVSHIEENAPQDVSRTFMHSIGLLAGRYNEDSDAFAAYKEEVSQKSTELMYAAFAEHPDGNFDPEDYVPREIDGENNDLQLLFYFDELRSKYDLSSRTPAIIASQAKDEIARLRREGVSDDTYVMQYQAYVYTHYSALDGETDGAFYPEYGWDLYFSNPYLTILLFAAMLILAPLVFVPEKTTGMLPILRASKRGRGRCVLCKMLVLMLSGTLITVTFSLSSLLIVYLKIGLSDATAPIQSVDILAAYPYAVTILMHFFFTLFLRVLTVLVFTFAVGALSVSTYGYLPSLLGGAALFTSQLLLENSPPSLAPAWRVLNLTALSSGIGISERFYSFDFFSLPLPFLYIAPAGLFVLFLLLSAALCVLYVRVTGEAFSRVTKPIKAVFMKVSAFFKKLSATPRNSSSRAKARGLFWWELKKLLTLPVLLLLLLLCVWEGVLCRQIYKNNLPDYDYRSYLTTYFPEYEGEYTAEKAASVRAEKAYEQSLEQKKKDISDGKITLTKEERIAFSRELEEAEKRSGALRVLGEQSEYLEKLREEQGVVGWYIRYESVGALCLSGFPMPLYVGILLLAVLSFVREYSGKSKSDRFILLQRTSRNGRGKTFLAKCGAVASASLVLTLLFSGAELLSYISSYNIGLSTMKAPLASLTPFFEVNCGVTILQYLVFVISFRILCALLLSLLITALSCLLEQPLPVLFGAAILTAFPAVLTYIGLEKAAFADLLALSGVSKAFLLSAKADLFSSDFGYFTMFFAAFALLTALLCTCAWRKMKK